MVFVLISKSKSKSKSHVYITNPKQHRHIQTTAMKNTKHNPAVGNPPAVFGGAPRSLSSDIVHVMCLSAFRMSSDVQHNGAFKHALYLELPGYWSAAGWPTSESWCRLNRFCEHTLNITHRIDGPIHRQNDANEDDDDDDVEVGKRRAKSLHGRCAWCRLLLHFIVARLFGVIECKTTTIQLLVHTNTRAPVPGAIPACVDPENATPALSFVRIPWRTALIRNTHANARACPSAFRLRRAEL